MSDEPEKLADGFFAGSITTRERACFEAGIKLGALFHSILRFPFKNEKSSLISIQEGFNTSFKAQPYVKDVDIKIVPPEDGKYTKSHEFDYGIIQDYMVDVTLKLNYKGIDLVAKIKWAPELNYPLMYIEEIT